MSPPVSIMELADLVHGRRTEFRVMVVIRAFFDASYTDPSGVTSIGGFMGPASAWEPVEKQWIDNLSAWGLEEFHLAKLPGKMGRTSAGDCAMSFGKILLDSSLLGVGAAIHDKDWSEKLGRTVSVAEKYHACVSMLFDAVEEWTHTEFKDEPVAFVFDRDVEPDDGLREIFDAFRERARRNDTFITGNRQCHRMLQCADLAAGKWRKAWLQSNFGDDSAFINYGQDLSQRFRGRYWCKETDELIRKSNHKRTGASTELSHGSLSQMTFRIRPRQ